MPKRVATLVPLEEESLVVGRAVLLGLAMIAFTVRDGCARGRRMTELTEDSAGLPVKLVIGEKVRVALREAGGTGYRWRVGTACTAVLHLERDETGNADGRPGASVQRSWVYRAVGEGTCELRFESARSWEKSATGKVVSFPVMVRGGGKAEAGSLRE